MFTERTGISDAELARRSEVSRQTIFRWRQGQSRAPRHREVVLRLADSLQLSDHERDALLLAAGFPPVGDEIDLGLSGHSKHLKAPFWKQSAFALPAAVFLILLLVGSALVLSKNDLLAGIFTDDPKPAAEGETLILVSEFSNYANEQIGFNVAGRLTQAIQDELAEGIPGNFRADKLPEVIASESYAKTRGAELGATLVIWGEYDSGRVIVHSTVPYLDLQTAASGREWFLSSSEELTTIINYRLPQEIRWEVLHILGQTYYLSGEIDSAEAFFQRASRVQTEDPSNAGLAYFFLGLIGSQRDDPDLDRVITYYTEAIASRPMLVSALNNRAIAYLERGSPGDLERARNDFERALELRPDLFAATHNLAITLFHSDPNVLDESIQLLERAAELNPDSPFSPHALCWYLTLDGNPEAALPHCDRAVDLDPSGAYIESRAVTHAKLGEFETAIVELEEYLRYLEETSPEEYQEEYELVNSWMTSLEAGVDPFNQGLILEILQ